GGTDEGRAMLQIVHDIAPGASLAFATAFVSEASFANNIIALKNAGADVIVDDVFYFDEPMFQDGIVAQAVDSVVAGGAAYFSAAGNEAKQSYQHAFNPGSTFTDGQFPSAGGAPHFFGGVAHNFAPGDPFQSLTIPAHGTVTFSMQWDTPSFSVSGSPGARNDLDIYLLNSSATQVIEGSTFDNVGADPVEIFSYTNNSGLPQNVNLMIVKFAGATNPNIVKYIYFGSMTVNEFDTQSSTIYGHSNANGAEAVGAAWYKQTPAFGVSPPVLESYSSAGGTAVLFDTDGNSISDARADKPEITAPDGANTTFFFAGDDPESDGHPNFFGTSAAAPHAGGVAALLLQAKPTLTPSDVYAALESSAINMGAAGFDNGSGFGLIQADASLDLLDQLDIGITQIDSSDPVAIGNNVTYTLTVINHRFIDATGVTVTDTLPAGLGFVSATPSQGSCVGTTTITCNLGGILNRGSATVAVVATTASLGQVTNIASVSANETDFNPTNNTSNQTTTITGPPLTVGANSLPNTAAGLNYNTNLQITGGAAPYHATVISGALPVGLSLNASTGVISGVPTKANNKKPPSFTVRITDNASGSVSKQFSIVVYPALVSKTKSLKRGAVGKSYAATLKASGGKLPYNWSLIAGSLPAGLAASPSGAITGMPSGGDQGTYPLTFRVTDSGGNFKDIPLSLVIQ
ncbi:MAG TPA: putative Ig domain-containing protein, partial [Candidatus Binatia bacterium]